MANGSVFGTLVDKNEDTLHKIISAPLIPIKGIMKLGALLPNAILRTNKKMKILQDNINSLSQEEFDVLTNSPEEMYGKYGEQSIKPRYDKEYLNPQFMKRYKVNNSYLDAVRNRLAKDDNYLQAYVENSVDKIQADMENETDLNRKMQMSYTIQMLEEGYAKHNRQLLTFEQGAKRKSSEQRNIAGWFLGKFNPDNRKENSKMADLAKQRRESAEAGDSKKYLAYDKEMQEFSKLQTNIKHGLREADRIDIGKYSIEGNVESVPDRPQDKGALLLTDFAIGVATAGFLRNIANTKAIQQHNAEIAKVNAQNKNIKVSGKVNVTDSPDAKAVITEQAKLEGGAGFHLADRTNLAKHGYRLDDTNYLQGDYAVHKAAAKTAGEIKNSLHRNYPSEALKTAGSYYNNVQNNAAGVFQNYIPTTPSNYAMYSALGKSVDINAINKFLTEGTIPYNNVVSGAMIDTINQFGGANSIFNAIADGLPLAFPLAQLIFKGQQNLRKDIRRTVKVDKQNNNQQNPNRADNEGRNPDRTEDNGSR